MLPLPLVLSTLPSGRAGEQEILLRSPPSSPREPDTSSSSNSGGSKVHRGGGKEGQMTEAVDFLAPADSMKALFRLPYNTQGVSVALHKFRGTLLVDGALDELYPESGGPDGNQRKTQREDECRQHQYQQYQYHGTGGVSSPEEEEEEVEEEQQQQQQQGEGLHVSNNQSARTHDNNRITSQVNSGNMHSLATTAAKTFSSHTKGALLVPSSFSAPPPPFHLPPLPREYPHLLHFQMHELSMTMGAELRVFR